MGKADEAPKFDVGKVVRYGPGSTALMRITAVSPDHGGPGDHFYHGTQYYGGIVSAYEDDCQEPTEQDLEQWRAGGHSYID